MRVVDLWLGWDKAEMGVEVYQSTADGPGSMKGTYEKNARGL